MEDNKYTRSPGYIFEILNERATWRRLGISGNNFLAYLCLPNFLGTTTKYRDIFHKTSANPNSSNKYLIIFLLYDTYHLLDLLLTCQDKLTHFTFLLIPLIPPKSFCFPVWSFFLFILNLKLKLFLILFIVS